MSIVDSFGSKGELNVAGTEYEIFRLNSVEGAENLPFSLKVLLENLLRTEDGANITADHVRALAGWDPDAQPDTEIQFTPARVIMQDFTGVPCVVDLATMREAVKELGGDPKRVNPLAPAEMVIDHSVQIDAFGNSGALERNMEIEYQRNGERYQFLRWGQTAFDDFKVVPPGTGIVHQVNIEYLARTVMTREVDGVLRAYPDTCVGTDSHTTMVNGLGVLGWGVGGIEAEAAMLGQPVSMLIPRVVGFKLTGSIPAGATATDVVLTITEQLRKHGVVGKFVEFYGEGVAAVPLANRATIGNMSPEFGSTAAMFPIDDVTLDYLRLTGRSERERRPRRGLREGTGPLARSLPRDQVLRVPRAGPVHGGSVHLRPEAPAGPHRSSPRPRTSSATTCATTSHDDLTDGSLDEVARRELPGLRLAVVHRSRDTHVTDTDRSRPHSAAHGANGRPSKTVSVTTADGREFELDHGAVSIASITSCTNTSNPSVMLAAALLARNAVDKGLTSKPWVKTSVAPGSKVVTDYYEKSGLTPYLEKLGFYIVGYGCATCIGNSGPLDAEISEAIQANDLSVTAVLSGNRNFEGRINPDVKMNYLASPPLVIAYALAGTMDFDFETDALGQDEAGNDVFLKDIWPNPVEVQQVIDSSIDKDMFARGYEGVFDGDDRWKALDTPAGDTFAWDEKSTYVRKPPYFEGMKAQPEPVQDITGARVLLKLGDSVTTDHISPAGSFKSDTPAGQYLLANGVERKDFNSYGSRRGNHEVMIRGTFANIRIKNQLLDGVEGGFTRDFTQADGPQAYVYDAAQNYQAAGTPLVVLAGKEYGSGSSRDWAAKGTALLGVKAVIAESYERIHRSNLIGMGVLPLQFPAGENAATPGPDRHGNLLRRGRHRTEQGTTPKTLKVTATAEDGTDQVLRCRPAHRYPGRSGLLPQRRHPAVRPAPDLRAH